MNVLTKVLAWLDEYDYRLGSVCAREIEVEFSASDEKNIEITELGWSIAPIWKEIRIVDVVLNITYLFEVKYKVKECYYFGYRQLRVIGGVEITRNKENEKAILRSLRSDDREVRENHSVYFNHKKDMFAWFSDDTIYIGNKIDKGDLYNIEYQTCPVNLERHWIKYT